MKHENIARKSFYTRYGKRWFDFVFAFLGLIILSPVIAITALTVKMKLGGPVIFYQKRPGYAGEIFGLVKFRSMTNERDADGNLLPDEVRLNAFGKKLRATSLDELPELWNIIKGDMSIVGPRPLLVQYLPLYSEYHSHRHDVRPGFTGYAQVNGRNSISWEEKFDLDLWYVQNVSFMLDLKIILKTILTVLRKDGISSQNTVTMEQFKGEKGVE